MVTRAFSRNKRSAVLIAVMLCTIIASSNILLNSYIHEAAGLFSWRLTSNYVYWIPTGNAPLTFSNEGKNSKDRSQEETVLIAKTPKLAALRLWDEYKSQHSNDRLLEEWEHHQRNDTATNRNFTLGF
jgi:hypothetical protein